MYYLSLRLLSNFRDSAKIINILNVCWVGGCGHDDVRVTELARHYLTEGRDTQRLDQRRLKACTLTGSIPVFPSRTTANPTVVCVCGGLFNS